MFELTDLYDKKNIPKVIYCIHALSFLLSKAGKAPSIKMLVGHLQFSDDVLAAAASDLAEAAVQMPSFGNISADLTKEMNQESDQDRLKREQREAEGRRLEEEETRLKQERIAEEKRIVKALAATKIQSTYRGHKQFKNYQSKLGAFKSNEKLFEKVRISTNDSSKLDLRVKRLVKLSISRKMITGRK
jgi:hypothetical protein